MDRIQAYLAMGGYAAYVWSAVGVAAVVMVGQVIISLRTLRRREAAMAELQARRKPRDGRARR